MKNVFISFFILFSVLTFAQHTEVVKRERAIVRKGPGSIYEIVAELCKGSSINVIADKSGWLQIENKHFSEDLICGYVSKKVIKERKSTDNIFLKMGTQKTDLRISRHGMSAGVKGFAQNYTKKFKGSPDFFEIYADLDINIIYYNKFRNETYQNFNLKKNQKRIPIPATKIRDFFSFHEEGIGIAIASGIASMGIYENRYLAEYVNQIGNLIVEASDGYDINFKFFILNNELVNAYACPGGIVFVTKGMLRSIYNEAELACVLAHEIAHVIRHHGMLEVEERKEHIMSDNAFAEMDKEMEDIGWEEDKEFKAVEEEMEELSFNIFETLVNGRLEKYEKEADELAMIYASRAGYDCREFISFLQRLLKNSSQTTNEHYTQKQISNRIIKAKNFLNNTELPNNLFIQKRRWAERGRNWR